MLVTADHGWARINTDIVGARLAGTLGPPGPNARRRSNAALPRHGFFTSSGANFCKWLIEHPKLYRFFTISPQFFRSGSLHPVFRAAGVAKIQTASFQIK
jgi:hypothetical protein